MENNNSSSDSESAVTPTKKRKTEKRLQKYKPEWEKSYAWIRKDSENILNAKCTLCNITISIGKSGIGQVS